MRNVTARLLRKEEGSTTVTTVLLIVAFVILILVGATTGVRVVWARQAVVVADLAAMADAVAVQESNDACKATELTAKSNHMRPVACGIDGGDVQVSVQRKKRKAMSRAGPTAVEDAAAGRR